MNFLASDDVEIDSAAGTSEKVVTASVHVVCLHLTCEQDAICEAFSDMHVVTRLAMASFTSSS